MLVIFFILTIKDESFAVPVVLHIFLGVCFSRWAFLFTDLPLPLSGIGITPTALFVLHPFEHLVNVMITEIKPHIRPIIGQV